MNNNFDVIISGCGPAGSILGYLLTQNNISTLILEKATFPRKKICAGGIQHRTLKLIPFDVSGVIEKTIYGIYFSLANKDIIHKKNDSPIMYTVERAVFDDFLAGKADGSGCRIQYGEGLTNYEVFNDYVRVHTGKSGYRAKILVGADGIRGAVHKKITGNSKFHKIIGYETEIENDNDNFMVKDRNGYVFDFKDSVRLDFNGVKKGYGWVFPKNNRMSCGVGAPAASAPKAKKYFKLFLSEFCAQGKLSVNGLQSGNGPESVSRLESSIGLKSFTGQELLTGPESATGSESLTGSGSLTGLESVTTSESAKSAPLSVHGGLKIMAHGIPVRKNDTPYCGYRVLAVGDAACFGDGFTGEGLYNAIKSSIIAADCIKNSLKNSDPLSV